LAIRAVYQFGPEWEKKKRLDFEVKYGVTGAVKRARHCQLREQFGEKAKPKTRSPFKKTEQKGTRKNRMGKNKPYGKPCKKTRRPAGAKETKELGGKEGKKKEHAPALASATPGLWPRARGSAWHASRKKRRGKRDIPFCKGGVGPWSSEFTKQKQKRNQIHGKCQRKTKPDRLKQPLVAERQKGVRGVKINKTTVWVQKKKKKERHSKNDNWEEMGKPEKEMSRRRGQSTLGGQNKGVPNTQRQNMERRGTMVRGVTENPCAKMGRQGEARGGKRANEPPIHD